MADHLVKLGKYIVAAATGEGLHVGGMVGGGLLHRCPSVVCHYRRQPLERGKKSLQNQSIAKGRLSCDSDSTHIRDRYVLFAFLNFCVVCCHRGLSRG